ncbi:MAG: polysaccharide biosynthesis tyrosine autokinase [Bryobacteraceae bacterium]
MNYGDNLPLRQTAELRPQPLPAAPIPVTHQLPAAAESGNVLLTALQAMWRRKLTMSVFILTGLLGGLVYLIAAPPVYRAGATLELQGINESFMNMNVVDPQAGTGNYSATQLNIQTQLRILESDSLRSAVYERLERESTPIVPQVPGLLGNIRTRLGLGENDPLGSLKQALAMAAGTAKARAITGTRILALTCDSTHPEIAAGYVNTLANEYMSQNVQFRSGTTQKTTQWLSGQLEETKIKLEQAETKLQAFVKQSGSMFTGEQDTLANTKLRQLQGELASIQADRIDKQSKYEMAMSANPDSLPDILDDTVLRGYQQKLVEMKREHAQLTTTLNPAYPKVKKLEAQIAEMESALAHERDAVIQRIKNEFEASKRRERLLSGAYGGQLRAVSSQSDKAVEYGMLKREVDMLRQTLNSMLQQSNQASILTAAPTANVRIIDSAKTPREPVQPGVAAGIAYGLGGGFGAGAALCMLLEGLRRRRSSLTFDFPGRSSHVLHLPELGVIPAAGLDPRLQPMRLGYGRKKKLLSLTIPKNVLGRMYLRLRGVVRPNERIELTTWHFKPSMIAESFRSVLASIRLMDRRSQLPQVMVATSPGPGEGKTTVLTNLGIAIAETGRRVLLVDADTRRPRLHDLFGVSNESGFSDLLLAPDRLNTVVIEPGAAREPVPQAMGPMLKSTPIPGLSVLPSGSIEGDILTHLLHSPNAAQVFANLRREFDVVLVDTPPMLNFSEARLLGQLSDGLILVLRAGETQIEHALAARKRLEEDGVPVIGTILNDWTPADGTAGYYKSYYYYRPRQKVAVA